MKDELSAWFQSLRELVQGGRTGRAVREVFDHFIDLAEQQDVETANETLACLEADALPVSVTLAFLTITSPRQRLLPNQHLSNRDDFRARIEAFLEKTEGAERTAQLLMGI